MLAGFVFDCYWWCGFLLLECLLHVFVILGLFGWILVVVDCVCVVLFGLVCFVVVLLVLAVLMFVCYY